MPEIEIDPDTTAEDLVIPLKWQLARYVLAMGWGTIQIGWAALGNTQCSLILIEQFGWTHSEAKTYNSILGSIGLGGVMIGALFGGPLITFGRRDAIFMMSVVMIMGVILTLI